jgi:hypothetical protein
MGEAARQIDPRPWLGSAGANGQSAPEMVLEEVRRMGHRAIDQWVDEMAETITGPKRPKLLELSEQMQRTRNRLQSALLKAVIEQTYAEQLERLHAPCPRCAKLLSRKRLDHKEISTLQGSVELWRPYFYCSACRCGFHPLDEELGLAERTHQYDVQVEVTQLAADLPYGSAAAHFERLTRVSVGEHVEHEVLNAISEEATLKVVVPSRAQIISRIREAASGGGAWRPVLVVGVDGAMAPIRAPGKRNEKRGAGWWEEVKGVRLYLLGRNGRIVHLLSWHRRVESHELEKDLCWIAQQIPQERVRIVLVGDGADWVWSTMTAAFPKARQVLDYYHCSGHVRAVAQLEFGETLQAQEWAEAQLARLFLGEAEQVIEELEELRARGSAADDDIRKLIKYLIDHQERIDYGKAKRSRMPRGSGAIESAHRFICHVRLKRPGAWWLANNSDAMLRIRCAIRNGTFARVFARYMQHQTRKRRKKKLLSANKLHNS